jgi:hypothetical protein
MIDKNLVNYGCTTRATFKNPKDATSHAMEITRQKQDEFYNLEKLVVPDQVKQTFKRKPYQV